MFKLVVLLSVVVAFVRSTCYYKTDTECDSFCDLDNAVDFVRVLFEKLGALARVKAALQVDEDRLAGGHIANDLVAGALDGH